MQINPESPMGGLEGLFEMMGSRNPTPAELGTEADSSFWNLLLGPQGDATPTFTPEKELAEKPVPLFEGISLTESSPKPKAKAEKPEESNALVVAALHPLLGPAQPTPISETENEVGDPEKTQEVTLRSPAPFPLQEARPSTNPEPAPIPQLSSIPEVAPQISDIANLPTAEVPIDSSEHAAQMNRTVLAPRDPEEAVVLDSRATGIDRTQGQDARLWLQQRLAPMGQHPSATREKESTSEPEVSVPIPRESEKPVSDEAPQLRPTVRSSGARDTTPFFNRPLSKERKEVGPVMADSVPPEAIAPQTSERFQVDSPSIHAPVPQRLEETVKTVSTLAQRGGGKMTVFLNPPDLGKLEIEVRTRGKQVEIEFAPEKAETAGLLKQHVAELKQNLESNDFVVRNVEFQSLQAGPVAPSLQTSGDLGGSFRETSQGQQGWNQDSRSQMQQNPDERPKADPWKSAPLLRAAPGSGSLDIQI